MTGRGPGRARLGWLRERSAPGWVLLAALAWFGSLRLAHGWRLGGWWWVCQLTGGASVNWHSRRTDLEHRLLAEPSALVEPAAHRARGRHLRVVGRVAVAKLGDHAGGILAVEEPLLGLGAEVRPGVGAGPVAGSGRLRAHRCEVVVERSAAGLGQAAVRRPEAMQREDEVAAAAPAAELIAGVVLAEPDLDAAAEVDLGRLPAGALDADRAHLALGRHPSGLVQRRRHSSIIR